jgi:hypothetical protein
MTKICHFTDKSEKNLPTVHITFTVDQYDAPHCTMDESDISLIDDEHLPIILPINLGNLRQSGNLSYNFKLTKDNFNHHFNSTVQIIKDSCDNYNVNIYLFLYETEKTSYATHFNITVIQHTYERVYNNVIIMNFMFGLGLITNSIKENQKKYLKVINYIKHKRIKTDDDRTLDNYPDVEYIYKTEYIKQGTSNATILYKIKDDIDGKRCSFGRLYQFTGTCWLNACFNALMLSSYTRELIMKRTRELIDDENKRLKEETTIESKQDVEKLPQNKYMCSLKQIKHKNADLTIENIISSVVYNFFILNHHLSHRDGNDIMIILGRKVKSHPLYSQYFEKGSRADDEESHRTDDEESHRTDDKESHRTDDEESHRTDDEESHRTDDEESHRTDDKESRRADDEESHRTDDEESHRTDDKESRRADDEESHRTDDKESRRADDEEGGSSFIFLNYMINYYLDTNKIHIKFAIEELTNDEEYESAVLTIALNDDKFFYHTIAYYTCNKKKYIYDSAENKNFEIGDITDYLRAYFYDIKQIDKSIKKIKSKIKIETSIDKKKELKRRLDYYSIVDENIENLHRVQLFLLIVKDKKDGHTVLDNATYILPKTLLNNICKYNDVPPPDSEFMPLPPPPDSGFMPLPPPPDSEFMPHLPPPPPPPSKNGGGKLKNYVKKRIKNKSQKSNKKIKNKSQKSNKKIKNKSQKSNERTNMKNKTMFQRFSRRRN